MSLQYKYSVIKDGDGNSCISIDKIYNFVHKVVIPDTIKGLPVKIIADGATESGSHLKSIKLPDSITYIGKEAFFECQNLTNINFPKKLKLIGVGAFECCGSLKNITLNDELECIEENAFYASGVSQVKIPDSVTDIKASAFLYSELSFVEFGKNVKFIDETAFSYCRNIESISLPKSLQYLDSSAFDNCPNLKTILIDSDINRSLVFDSLFYNCPSLEKIITSKDNKRLISINNVLYDKSRNTLVRFPPNGNVANLKIPEWVDRFSSCSFEGNKNLKRIDIPNEKIKYIELSGLFPNKSLVVNCIKDSDVETWAKEGCLKITYEKTLNTFLNEVSDESRTASI